jgi:hypothetical protein
MRPVLRRSLLTGAFASTLGTIVTRPTSAGPAAHLWAKWALNNAASQTVVDQQVWADFLRRYLVEETDGINRMRYGQVTVADKTALARHIDAMSHVPVLQLNQH